MNHEPIKMNGAVISSSVLSTLEYFQSDDNKVINQDIAVLKDLLVLVSLPDNDNMPLGEEKIDLVENLSCFIRMIEGLKAHT